MRPGGDERGANDGAWGDNGVTTLVSATNKRTEVIAVLIVIATVQLLHAREWYAGVAVAMCGLVFVRSGVAMLRGARR